jgi:TonB-linked SusC/RagA family outer membrane protein
MKKQREFYGNFQLHRKIVRIMKLTILFSFAFVISTSAASYSQTAKLSLKLKNQSLVDALKQIEEQSEYYFYYNNNDILGIQGISVDIQGQPIEKVLDELLQNTGLNYRMIDRYIVIKPVNAQVQMNMSSRQGNITGLVKDAAGAPLPGVTVVVKGTTIGVITGADGSFSLPGITDDAILVFSFVGMKTQEIPVAGKSIIEARMEEETIGIEEVVAIGYGTAKKKDLTGSVVRADLSSLQESPNVSIGQSLQGTIPGLNVGAVTTAGSDPSITIRGRNSLSGGTSPLIVLDGIIYRGSLVDINPNDIESIDILKDASASAIYGSQASNGVMLITSKTVKAIHKPIIEYTGSFTLQESTNKKMKPMDREGFLQLVADRFLEESRTGPDLLEPNPDWNVANHLMDANAVNGYLNGTDTDWWGLGTNDHPYIQMHNLSVRGRSELSNYFMSVGYTDQKNLVINDTYNRYNIRLNLDTKITDWLKIGAQTFFTLSDWSGISSIGSALPPVCADVDPETGQYVIYPYKGTLNPALSRQQDNLDKRYNFFCNFYLDVDIPFIKGLNYRLNFSQNLINDKDYTFNPYGSELTGSATKANASQYSWTADNILTYKQTFGKHDINSTLVYGVEKREYESTNASGSDYSNMSLGYNYLGAADASRQVISSNAWEESSLYAMLRLGYTFSARYSFTGTLRRDGFSGFGKNNKFALFPSAAVAWRLSEESFIRDHVKWMDNLKLRLSYGSNGNRTVSRYQTLAKMTSSDAYLYGDGAPAEKGVYLSAMANDNLKWETTNTFNIGLDFSFLDERVFGSLEYYRSKTHNLLYDINIPVINMNISSIPTNIGKLANRGQELSITGVPVKTKDFEWGITFNYSRNRNKVVSILGLDNDGDGKEDDLVSSKIFMGHPYGVCYDFELIGMWQMEDYKAGIIPDGFTYGTYKVKDQNDDGLYTTANDRKILGYTDPSYRFSIDNVLRYKDWELKVFINSIQGGKDFYYAQPASGLANPDNIYQNNSFKWDYWTPENPNARYRQIGFFTPALDYSYSPYIQRSFIRLQNLTLSYRVPAALLKKIGINNFKVYVTGTNLFTITDWDGWDPETSTGLGGDYPLLKTYSMGINFDF